MSTSDSFLTFTTAEKANHVTGFSVCVCVEREKLRTFRTDKRSKFNFLILMWSQIVVTAG